MVASGVSGLSGASSPVPCPGGADLVGVREAVLAGVCSVVASGSMVAVVSASTVVVTSGLVVLVVTTVAVRIVVTVMPAVGEAKTREWGWAACPTSPVDPP